MQDKQERNWTALRMLGRSCCHPKSPWYRFLSASMHFFRLFSSPLYQRQFITFKLFILQPSVNYLALSGWWYYWSTLGVKRWGGIFSFSSNARCVAFVMLYVFVLSVFDYIYLSFSWSYSSSVIWSYFVICDGRKMVVFHTHMS